MFRLQSFFTIHPRRTLVFVGVLMFGVLIGAASVHSAHAATPSNYIVQVGAGGPANTDLLQFAPGSLKVHRGDTVTWLINGFHNVHVGATQPATMVIAADVNGKPMPQFNPMIAFPYGPKSGSTYQGGEAGSGLPLAVPGISPVFSLKIDVKPGSSIAFLCDIHPGMAGSITVVEDSESVSGPTEIAFQAAAEFGASIGAANEAATKMEADSAGLIKPTDGPASVQMGNDVGRAALNQFFPYATEIKAGQSVTWKFGESAIEAHTVSMLPLRGQEVVPIPQQGKPPVLSIGPGIAPLTQSGTTIKNGDKASSGLLIPIPGRLPTYSLTFAEPGIYPYFCNIHTGMHGVVVVTK